MTLDGVMVLILRYFTEFVYAVVVNNNIRQITRFQNLILIVYDHTNTICAINSASIWAKQEEAIAFTSDCSCPCLLMSFLWWAGPYCPVYTAGWMGESTLTMAD